MYNSKPQRPDSLDVYGSWSPYADIIQTLKNSPQAWQASPSGSNNLFRYHLFEGQQDKYSESLQTPESIKHSDALYSFNLTQLALSKSYPYLNQQPTHSPTHPHPHPQAQTQPQITALVSAPGPASEVVPAPQPVQTKVEDQNAQVDNKAQVVTGIKQLSEEERLKNKRERNRKAAANCRKRKEDKIRRLEYENSELRKKIANLEIALRSVPHYIPN